MKGFLPKILILRQHWTKITNIMSITMKVTIPVMILVSTSQVNCVGSLLQLNSFFLNSSQVIGAFWFNVKPKLQAGWQVEFGSLSKSHFHNGIQTVANGRGGHSEIGNCKSNCFSCLHWSKTRPTPYSHERFLRLKD